MVPRPLHVPHGFLMMVPTPLQLWQVVANTQDALASLYLTLPVTNGTGNYILSFRAPLPLQSPQISVLGTEISILVPNTASLNESSI